MSTLYARLLAATVGLLTAFFGRWRRLTVLARLSDRLAPEARVTVNGTDITLFVPDRTAVYWPRHGFASEPGTLAWIDGFSAGDVLYDIGANVGIFTIYAAKAAGVRVVAFEPNPFSFRVLVRNLELNGIAGRVTPLCLALGGATALESLALSHMESGSGGNRLTGGKDGGGALSFETLAFGLDDLAGRLPAPSRLKLDVDGNEPEILAGARATLADPRLKSVLCEFDGQGEETYKAMDSLLRECGLVEDRTRPDDGSANRLYVRN